MSKRRRVLAGVPPELLPDLLSVIATLRGADPSCKHWDRHVLGEANLQMFDRIKCADAVRMSGVPGSCSVSYTHRISPRIHLVMITTVDSGIYDVPHASITYVASCIRVVSYRTSVLHCER